jgi:hypothetical protein
LTTQQLYLFNGLYLIVDRRGAFTRAAARRLGALVAGRHQRGRAGHHRRMSHWWHMVIDWEPHH